MWHFFNVVIVINVSCFQCKNVMKKFQRTLDKEGHQIVPLLTELWKKSEDTGYMSGNCQIHIQKIDYRLENFGYNGVMEFVSDVQLLLKGAVQYYKFSHEVFFINFTYVLASCCLSFCGLKCISVRETNML